MKMQNLELGPVYHVYDDDQFPNPLMEVAELFRIEKRTHHFRFANGEEYSKGSSDGWRSSAAEAWKLYAVKCEDRFFRFCHRLEHRGRGVRLARKALREGLARLDYAWAQADAAAADAELSYSI